jgi:hypothetical protein
VLNHKLAVRRYLDLAVFKNILIAKISQYITGMRGLRFCGNVEKQLRCQLQFT